MTAPGPHNPPESRRAARLLRERDAERAPESAPLTRRAARTSEILEPAALPVSHARSRRAVQWGVALAAVIASALVIGSAAAVTAAVSGTENADAGSAAAASVNAREAAPLPERAESIPAPTVTAAPAVVDLCANPAVTAALAAGDDAAVIAGAGGAANFRAAVASGSAPCVALDDPSRLWIVVNKQRPYAQIDFRPSSLSMPDGVRSLEGGPLRTDAAAALSALVAAAAQAGVGEIALESGFRSYSTQQTTYANHVASMGAEQAALSSARPGFSEHQSGLGADVVACAGGCGTFDDLAATAQGQWIVEHAWEFGFITRYEAGYTPTTGYSPEPWHLRFIGVDLARAYHEGGWHTLEEFFGLPAAADYAG